MNSRHLQRNFARRTQRTPRLGIPSQLTSQACRFIQTRHSSSSRCSRIRSSPGSSLVRQDGPRLVAFYKVDHSRQWFEERILEIRDAFNRGQPSRV